MVDQSNTDLFITLYNNRFRNCRCIFELMTIFMIDYCFMLQHRKWLNIWLQHQLANVKRCTWQLMLNSDENSKYWNTIEWLKDYCYGRSVDSMLSHDWELIDIIKGLWKSFIGERINGTSRRCSPAFIFLLKKKKKRKEKKSNNNQ